MGQMDHFGLYHNKLSTKASQLWTIHSQTAGHQEKKSSAGQVFESFREFQNMMRAATFVFLFLLIFISSSSQGRSIIPRPRPLSSSSSFKINTTQSENQAQCSFTVVIRTSCSSTRYTRDRISLAFGDAYGNQVYAPRLDDPSSGTFESCSSDTFHIYGPCTYQICYLYLYRSGRDGWRPYDVTVSGYNTSPVTFYYDVFIPRDIWYGFDYCGRYVSKASSSTSAMK